MSDEYFSQNDTYDAYDFQSSPPSQSTIDFPQTQSTDLPYVAWESGDWSGTSSQPAVSEIPRSTSGFDLSGILKPITATAQSFLDVWGKVAQISTSAATQKASQEIQRAQLDLARTQTTAGIDTAKMRALTEADIARTRGTTEAEVARIQAQNQVAKESAILAATRGGNFSVASNPNFLVLGGLAVSLYLAFRKGGAK